MSLNSLPLLIEAEQLAPYIADDKLRILDLSRESVFHQIHLPGAVLVRANELVEKNEDALGKLPSPEHLQAWFNRLGISEQHHVVVYDDEGGAWAGRCIWNLHCAGFLNTSLLNGGIHAWLAAGFDTYSEVKNITPADQPFQINLSQQDHYRIQYDELSTLVAQQKIQLWDCRSEQEYIGIRLAARRGGHIPNAIWYEWSSVIDRRHHLKLHQLSHIQQQLQHRGFDLSQPVVVYCQSHHRSGLAYIIGRLLNWQIRAYDGAWSEWGNCPNTAITTGENP